MQRITALLCIFLAADVRGQGVGTNIEIVGGVNAIGTVSRVDFNAASRTMLGAGLRGDVGIQGQHLALGVQVGIWDYRNDADLSGGSIDVGLFAELRRARNARTSLRIYYAVTDDRFDSGGELHAPIGDITGSVLAVGAGYEWPVPFARVYMHADVVAPAGGAGDAAHRKAPGVEIGVGIRWRTFHSILPLGSRRI